MRRAVCPRFALPIVYLIRMKITHAAVTAAALSLSSLHADESLYRYLSTDVDCVLSVRSIAEVHQSWEGHPFEQLWNQEFRDFFAGAFDTGSEPDEDEATSFMSVLEDEFELTLDELYELFPGQITLSLFNWVEMLSSDTDPEFTESGDPDVVLLAQYAGDAEALNRLMDVQFHRNWDQQKAVNPLIEHKMLEERFMGETLYLDERFDGENTEIEDAYALVDGVLIIATPVERLRNAVEAIKEGVDQPLTEDDAFLRSREEGGRGDVSVYLNLSEIMPQLTDAMLDESIDSSMAMVGVTSKSLTDALSLDVFQALFVDFDLVEDGALCSAGVVYREKKGLVEMLAYDSGGLPEARYVPTTTLTSSLSSFNISEMLAGLEKVLRVASPTMMPLFDMQLFQVKKNTGIDLRASLLDNFGGGIVSMASIPEQADAAELMAQPEQVVIMAIKDSESLSAALEALKDLVPMVKPMLKEQDYEGYTIYSFSDASGVESSEQISYTITRDKLIVCVGRVGYLQTVLTRLDSNNSGLWEAEDSEILFERIAKPHPVSRSYMDLSQYTETILETLAETLLFDGILGDLDFASLPSDLEAELRLVSELNEEPDGFFVRMLLVDQDASPKR